MSDRLRAVWAVLPVKGFSRGKSRLGSVLSDPVRSAFAEGLFDHVAGVLCGAQGVAGVIVVTDDATVAERARALGCRVVSDPPEPSLAEVVDRGLLEARSLGASAAFVCMADLPTLSVSDVGAVLEALTREPVVVAPDAVEAGTNLLATAPPFLFPSCFGRADSFQAHLARAAQHGHQAVTLRLAGLSFDVDGPEDLERLD